MNIFMIFVPIDQINKHKAKYMVTARIYITKKMFYFFSLMHIRMSRENINFDKDQYCPPFIDCICEKNNVQIHNAKDIDVVKPMYYSDNYSKNFGSLRQYCRDEPHAAILNSESFKSKTKITGKALPIATIKTRFQKNN